MRIANARWPFAAGLLHSALMVLAFPPFGLWGCALVAPLPLIAAGFDRAQRHLVWTSLAAGLGAVPVWAYTMQWVVPVSLAGYFPLLGVLGLYAAIVTAGCMLIRRRWPAPWAWLLAPVWWTAFEFFRGELAFDGYPWLLLGHPLIDAPGVPRVGASLGVYAASFVAAAPACFVAAAVAGRTRTAVVRAACALGLLAGLSAAAGLVGGRGVVPGRSVRVAVIQTNVPQDNKTGWTPARRVADWERMAALTREASRAEPRPEVIFWPETMFPGEFLDGASVATMRESGLGIPYTDPDGREQLLRLTEFADRLVALQTEVGIPMVIGAMAADGLRFEDFPGGGVEMRFDRRFNSAFVVAGGAVTGDRYDKLALTPFGEVMPYISHWPWLERQLLALGARGMAFDLSPGVGPGALDVPAPSGPVRWATPICFEAVMTGVVRSLVRSGERPADAMANLTNDGWFAWFDGGRAQHLQIARWRAVELGRPMIRAANTGISCLIDRHGRVVQRAAPRTEAVVAGAVTLTSGATIYARVGNVFGWLAFGVGTLFVLAAGWGEVRWRRRRGSASGATGEAEHEAA